MARNQEAQVQASIVQYLRAVAPQCKTAAVPNGGLRSKREAALLKWTGVLAGMPDLVMIAPGAKVHCIEVKTRTGVLSGDQKLFRDWCFDNGVPWMTARSIDDVKAALFQWGINTREAA